ncbi:MAG: phosphate ABC transporter permease PstA [Chloroflexi bacterium]|nr:MAG: phosphate ABC transporter permease PstA [Chloroflexota bacterium]
MSATVSERDSSAPNPFQPPQSARGIQRQFSNGCLVVLATLFALLAVGVLIYLLFYVILNGIRYINLDFSLGIFTAIYLSEFGRGRLANVVRSLVDLLTGVPTIIFGLFAWVIIVVPQQTFSGFAGGVALGIIMIPIVARTTEDVLHLVPREQREASLALGATEARTTLRVVIPAALSGIVTGIVLAMARVAGETAPLLMTAFGTTFRNSGIFQPMDALTLRVYNFTLSPYQLQVNQAYAGAFVLILLILITSFTVRWFTGGFRRRF